MTLRFARFCMECGSRFKPLENGILAVELVQHEEQDVSAYKVWMADSHVCHCDHRIVAGFGNHAVRTEYRHTQGEIRDFIDKYQAVGSTVFYIEEKVGQRDAFLRSWPELVPPVVGVRGARLSTESA